MIYLKRIIAGLFLLPFFVGSAIWLVFKWYYEIVRYGGRVEVNHCEVEGTAQDGRGDEHIKKKNM